MNILTSFPFTFKLTVPGLSNPFTSLATNPPSPTTSKTLPAQSGGRGEPSVEHRSRPFFRPIRPLPVSVTPATPMPAPLASSRGIRPSIPAFSPSPSPTPSTSLSLAHGYSHLAPRNHFPGSHSPSPTPVNRKRGWEPSFSPSPSETTLASTNGYLDTPAKYRDMAGLGVVEVEHVDGIRDLGEDDLPPAKRRRGLAGSIVSTAWSAALIGTAVGLTVYKLWRNRGRNQEDADYPSSGEDSKMHGVIVEDMDATSEPEPPSPPPPYNHEWTAIDYHQPSSYLHPSLPQQQQMHHVQQQQLLSPRPKGKERAPVTPRSQRKTAGRSHTHVKRVVAKSTGRGTGHGRSRPGIPSEFDFDSTSGSRSAGTSPTKRARSAYEPSFTSTSSSAHSASTSTFNTMEDNDPEDADDQMDWIGGKLAQLIEEGKKALGKEVVVMSEAREDEVDDGSGAWVSDDDDDPSSSFHGGLGVPGGRGTKRRGSVRSRTGRGLGMSNANANGSSASLNVSTGGQGHGWGPPTTPSRTRGSAPASPSGVGGGFGRAEEPDQFESPEVREMMERARAKIAARMGRS